MQTWNPAVNMSTTALTSAPQITLTSRDPAETAIRNAALEEAARTVEARPLHSDFPRDLETVRDAADAIRALKS